MCTARKPYPWIAVSIRTFRDNATQAFFTCAQSVSLVLTLLDVEAAPAGAIINVVLVAPVLRSPRLSGWIRALGSLPAAMW